MLKKIISKKSIVILIIIICCWALFVLLKFAPNKISYNVERDNDNYIVSIFNNRGKRYMKIHIGENLSFQK